MKKLINLCVVPKKRSPVTLRLVLLFMLASAYCFGQSNFARGEELLMQNKPGEAVVFLERAIAEDPAHVQGFLYLGIVYEQLGRTEQAITVYRRILPQAGVLQANVANNLANAYFQRGNTEEAEKYYTDAIGFNGSYSRAYLGRANTRIKAGNLTNAILDYEQYLLLEPSSGQRENIERLIALLRQEALAEEMRRQMAEEEARRLAEERQRLLDSVSASLQSAADSSQGLSTGAEGVEGYEGEFILE